MNMSILDATVQEGRMKGWPLRAALAVANGVSAADVRSALIEQYEQEKRDAIERFDGAIAAVKALPEVAAA